VHRLGAWEVELGAMQRLSRLPVHDNLVTHLGYHVRARGQPALPPVCEQPCAAPLPSPVLDPPSVFFVLEFTDAGSLEGLPPLPTPALAYVARGVLAGLAFLHAHAVAHGDVRAVNVRLTSRGQVKLGGLRVGTLRGCPARDWAALDADNPDRDRDRAALPQLGRPGSDPCLSMRKCPYTDDPCPGKVPLLAPAACTAPATASAAGDVAACGRLLDELLDAQPGPPSDAAARLRALAVQCQSSAPPAAAALLGHDCFRDGATTAGEFADWLAAVATVKPKQ
jgi:serine/threonine protein kinase